MGTKLSKKNSHNKYQYPDELGFGGKCKTYAPPNIFKRIAFKANKDCKTTRVDLDIPNTRAFRVDNLLAKRECEYFMGLCEKKGFQSLKKEYPAEFRNNERVLVFSDEVAAALWERLSPILDRRDIMSIRPMGFGNMGTWKPFKVNECMKFGKYKPGTHHKPHMDGPYVPRLNESSVYTVLIYLNDNFEGGETKFVRKPNDQNAASDLQYNSDTSSCEVLETVRPVQGSALIFTHDTLHEGTVITKGNKYIIRTEIMFQRTDTKAIPKTVHDQSAEETYLEQQNVVAQGLELEEKGDTSGGTEYFHKSLQLQAKERRTTGEVYLLDEQVLPLDIMLFIFSYFRPAEIADLMVLCKVWYDICMDGILWRRLFMQQFPKHFKIEKRFPNSALYEGSSDHVKDWYTCYRQKLFVQNHFRAVVFDTGSVTTQCGALFTGKPGGALITYHSEVTPIDALNYHSRYYGERFYVGEFAGSFQTERTGPVQKLVSDGELNVDICREVWDVAYGDLRLGSPMHPVLFAVPACGYSDETKLKIKKLFLKGLRVPGLCFLPSAVLSLRCYDKETGVVISWNQDSYSVSVVYQGEVIVPPSVVKRFASVELDSKESEITWLTILVEIADSLISQVSSAVEYISKQLVEEKDDEIGKIRSEFYRSLVLEGSLFTGKIGDASETKFRDMLAGLLKGFEWNILSLSREDVKDLLLMRGSSDDPVYFDMDPVNLARTFGIIIGGLKLSQMSHFVSMCSNIIPGHEIVLEPFATRRRTYRKFRGRRCEFCSKNPTLHCERCFSHVCTECFNTNSQICDRCILELNYQNVYRATLDSSNAMPFHVKVENRNRLSTLLELWLSQKRKAIVYCNDRNTLHWLERRILCVIEDNPSLLPCYVVHDEMTQKDFYEILKRFEVSGSLLLSTDTKFARTSNDIRDQIAFIVNFDLPKTYTSYDYRVGNISKRDTYIRMDYGQQEERDWSRIVMNFVEEEADISHLTPNTSMPLPDFFNNEKVEGILESAGSGISISNTNNLTW